MRILIADDSSAVRSFLSFSLSVFRNLGLDQAKDGVEAVKKLKENVYDLVLLDINMPLMDGMKVLSMLRREEGETLRTPVIVITSEGDDETARRATELGAAKVLHKPVAAYAVRDAVDEVLQRRPKSPPKAEAEAEQRREPRLQIEVTVVISGEMPWQLKTFDISPYGAFLVTDEPMEVGVRARMFIELPHLALPVEVSCMVVHSRPKPAGGLPAGFGVSFEHGSLEVSELLVSAFLTPG